MQCGKAKERQTKQNKILRKTVSPDPETNAAHINCMEKTGGGGGGNEVVFLFCCLSMINHFLGGEEKTQNKGPKTPQGLRGQEEQGVGVAREGWQRQCYLSHHQSPLPHPFTSTDFHPRKVMPPQFFSLPPPPSYSFSFSFSIHDLSEKKNQNLLLFSNKLIPPPRRCRYGGGPIISTFGFSRASTSKGGPYLVLFSDPLPSPPIPTFNPLSRMG